MSYVDTVRSVIRRSPMLYDVVERPYASIITARWQRQGAPIPAPGPVKRDILRCTAQKHHLRVLIETGTYLGDTVMALHRDFDRIVSVELSPELYARAKRQTGNLSNVELLLGDSAKVLPGILATLDQPALFWLDAHYSGGVTSLGDRVSPISSELDVILGHTVKGHVVLIDDAREFHASERSGYPSVEVIVDAARQHNYAITEKDDVFFLVPNQQPQSRDD